MNYHADELKRIIFSRALFCGYSQMQVDKAIEKISEDFRAYESEIEKLKNQMDVLESKVAHYRTIEESLQHTLLIAHHTSETIKNNALDKAATIIREAEARAQKIINDANNEVAKIKQTYEDSKRLLVAFKTKSESLIRSQLDVLTTAVDEASE